MSQNGQNLYEILFRNLKEAVVFADAQGRIQIFNAMAEEYFQVRMGKVLGKKLDKAIPYKNIRRQFDSVYEKKERFHDIELAVPLPGVSFPGTEGTPPSV